MAALISGACIRFTDDGPRWHVNSGHHAIGLIDTSSEPFINSSGWLEFPLKDGGATNGWPVVSMTIASDETLAARGIFGGASSGTSEVRVRFSKAGVNGADTLPLNLSNPVHYERISGDNSNIWITLVHSMPQGLPVGDNGVSDTQGPVDLPLSPGWSAEDLSYEVRNGIVFLSGSRVKADSSAVQNLAFMPVGLNPNRVKRVVAYDHTSQEARFLSVQRSGTVQSPGSPDLNLFELSFTLTYPAAGI